MPQPNDFDRATPPPIATRRCPACGEPMFLAVVEPTYQRGYDIRTFKCGKCAYAELALTSYDETEVA